MDICQASLDAFSLFPDVFGKGTLAGFAVGQPFIEDSVGDVTQLNMEAFYRFPLNDNITIAPLVLAINNSGNLNSNGTLYTGTIRTLLSFYNLLGISSMAHIKSYSKGENRW